MERIIPNVKLTTWVVVLWIVGGLFFCTLLAQMIHYEIKGAVYSVNFTDLTHFWGKWVLIGYVLDAVLVALFARWIMSKREKMNE